MDDESFLKLWIQQRHDRVVGIAERFRAQPGHQSFGDVAIDAGVGLQHEIITLFAQNETQRKALNGLLGDLICAAREIEMSHPSSCFPDQTLKKAKTEMALNGAHARHASARANKAKVFTWCDENMARFKSMDDAALDIAETFVKEKFRTVREWMTEWKKLRSASTP